MLRNYRFWVKASAILMFITALLHATSLFIAPDPKNETERQLVDLVSNYKADLGAGFHRSFSELFTALSSCFSLLCLLGGLILIYLVRKDLDSGTMKGVLNICLLVFGFCFVVMAVFTFLPPIVCTGLVFAALIAARIAVAE
jgi:hypothetical protein